MSAENTSRRRVRAVLFDAVGTVIYPDPPVADAYFAIGRRFGSTVTPEQARERFRDAFRLHGVTDAATDENRERERWRRIVGHVFTDAADRFEELFQTLWDYFAAGESWRAFEDVSSAFAAVRARGLRIGIASNFDRRLHPALAAHPVFASAEIFVSSELGAMKPHRGFFRAIESRLNLQPEEILLVGDDLRNDVEGALDAGWQAVHLDRTDAANHSLHTTAARIGSLAELAELLPPD